MKQPGGMREDESMGRLPVIQLFLYATIATDSGALTPAPGWGWGSGSRRRTHHAVC